MPPARIALWVFSLGGIALMLRALVQEPPPFWVAVVLLIAYCTFTTLGWIFPHLEMYADVLWRGEPGSRGVALTFDDGPHPKSTRAILRILERGGHTATFFVVGKKALLHPDVVREINEAGHTIGLHGFGHDRLYAFKPPRELRDDIERTQDAIEQACGVRPRLLRPPVGHVSPRVGAAAKRMGCTLVAWSVRGFDGLGTRDADRVVRRVSSGLRDGAIVMLHDAAERDDFEPIAVEALPAILKDIQRLNLTTVSVEEFLDVLPAAAERAEVSPTTDEPSAERADDESPARVTK